MLGDPAEKLHQLGIFPADDLPEVANLLLEGGAVAHRAELEDLLMAREVEAFLVEVELLVHLLPWPQAGEDDFDVALGLEAGEADQLAGQVGDFHRFTHVEDKDLAALGEGAGLDDEARGLGDGHEIARDLRVGHRDLALLPDLLLEQRDHAAIAAEDIAKPHGGEFRQRIADAEGLDHQLGDPFRRTHDIGRVDRLVGRDQDEMAHPVARRRLGDIVRAKDIVLDRFARAVLHQGNMLVRRCMEDDAWLVLGEDLVEAIAVAHRADQDLELELVAIEALELVLQLVGVVLIDVKDNQAGRLETGDLAAKLGADRTTAPGDENGLATQVAGDRARVEDDLVAAQEVLDLHVLDVLDTDRAIDQVLQEWNDFQLAAGATGDFDDVAHIIARRTRDRQDDLVDLVLGCGSWDGVAVAVDRHAEDAEGMGLAVVIDDHDRFAVLVIVLQLADQLAACGAGADDHDAALVGGGGAWVRDCADGAVRGGMGCGLADVGDQAGQGRDAAKAGQGHEAPQPDGLAGAVGGDAVDDPHAHDQDERQQPVDDIHRARELLLLCQAQGGDQAEESRLEQRADEKDEVLADAGIAPELVVEAHGKVKQASCGQVLGPAVVKMGLVLCGHGEVEAELERQEQREVDQPQIEKDRGDFIQAQAVVTNTDHRLAGLLFDRFSGGDLDMCPICQMNLTNLIRHLTIGSKKGRPVRAWSPLLVMSLVMLVGRVGMELWEVLF